MAIGHNHFVVHVGMACTKYEEIDNRKKTECVGAAPEFIALVEKCAAHHAAKIYPGRLRRYGTITAGSGHGILNAISNTANALDVVLAVCFDLRTQTLDVYIDDI